MTDRIDASPAAAWFDTVDVAALRARGGAKWTKYGDSVLPAWVADMDFPPAPPVAAAIEDVLARGQLGYPAMTESDAVAEAFSGWAARRYGWSVDPSLVLVTTDVLQPLQALVQLCSEPGDGVVLQTPIYPPFHTAVTGIGRVIVENRLGAADEGYPMDLEGLAAGTDERTRIVLLCNPHNPSGRVFTRAELLGLAELAIERDWLVVSDEIHADLLYPGATHIPFATLGPEVAARTVTLTSSTKTFNIAGLRLAIAVFGTHALLERYRSIPRFLLGGSNVMGVAASIAAWRDGEPWLAALVDHLRTNRDLVVDTVNASMAGVRTVAPEATYLAWLDCRELLASGRASHAATFFVQEAGVGLNDGADFGVVGEGFVRLNFATSRPVLREILQRMVDACAG
ncbi:MAG: PatB family C-S lyase [Acidimicrobiales bacterium]|nr:PatB family C-S lyase [Acidimicrobiales bacterium]